MGGRHVHEPLGSSNRRSSVPVFYPFPRYKIRAYGSARTRMIPFASSGCSTFDANKDVAAFTHDLQITNNLGHLYKLWDNVSFQADDDWLENSVIVVKNLSNKDVVAGTVNIRFPETGSGAPGDAFIGPAINLGQWPEYALHATRDGHRLNVEPLNRSA